MREIMVQVDEFGRLKCLNGLPVRPCGGSLKPRNLDGVNFLECGECHNQIPAEGFYVKNVEILIRIWRETP